RLLGLHAGRPARLRRRDRSARRRPGRRRPAVICFGWGRRCRPRSPIRNGYRAC
ncbi:hypothetical protein HMPREF0731_0747, partial [Pseudoroseomonas cervicalis ATCC 49957]